MLKYTDYSMFDFVSYLSALFLDNQPKCNHMYIFVYFYAHLVYGLEINFHFFYQCYILI